MTPAAWPFVGLSLLLATSTLAAQGRHPLPPPAQRQVADLFESQAARGPIGLYVYRPGGLTDSTTRLPLLVFLHGNGERGNGTSELSRILKFGPPRLIEQGRDYPFFVVSPQLPVRFERWPVPVIHDIIVHAVHFLPVDSSRIYLTGLSDGGDAVWAYSIAHPEVPAAVVPIAAEGPTADICRMRDVPVWAFHGELDRDTRLAAERKLVDALNACVPPPDEPARLTVYAGAGHLVWSRTYQGSDSLDIYSWFLAHHR